MGTITEKQISTSKEVKILECQQYDYPLVEEKCREIIDHFFTADSTVSLAGKTILLKPNILADKEVERRITTDPSIFEACALIFREKGATVMAGDSPAMHTKNFKAEKCGIQGICDKHDIPWINFTDKSITRNGFKLTEAVETADMIVSLSKLKTHELTYFTGSVKNLYGLIPGFTKSKLHVKYPDRNSFSAMLIDLYETIKPDFTIMDGIIGMEGPGPHNGTPRACNVILGSTNCAAVDMAASCLIGYNPLDIPMIKIAVERNLIPDAVEKLIFTDIDPTKNKIRSFKKIPLAAANKNILLQFITGGPFKKVFEKWERRPIFDDDKCIRCGKCIKMCAAEAITLSEKKGKAIDLNRSNCIRCYCCAEVCPESAVHAGRKYSD